MIAYAITDPSTLSFDRLQNDMQRFAAAADMIVYRDKANPDYASDAERFLRAANQYPFRKILLHGTVSLAVKLGAEGVHLSGSQIEETAEAKAKGLFVIVSTHTFDEAKKAEELGADMVTFSPIFSTPGKGEAKGLGVLNKLKGIISLPIIALGGILTKEQIDACQVHGASGFASIRYFSDQGSVPEAIKTNKG